MKLNLYLVTQNSNNGYDTYDSMVVAAANVKDARGINPRGNEMWGNDWSGWCSSPDLAAVTMIGVADKSITTSGVIIASYNAG